MGCGRSNSPTDTPRCSDTNSSRTEVILRRTSSCSGVFASASIARSQSLSNPIDRSLRFDEPTRSSRSSLTTSMSCKIGSSPRGHTTWAASIGAKDWPVAVRHRSRASSPTARAAAPSTAAAISAEVRSCGPVLDGSDCGACVLGERWEQTHVRPQQVDLEFGPYPDQPTKERYRCLRMMEESAASMMQANWSARSTHQHVWPGISTRPSRTLVRSTDFTAQRGHGAARLPMRHAVKQRSGGHRQVIWECLWRSRYE